MSVVSKVKKFFASLSTGSYYSSDKIAAMKSITNNLASYLIDLSKFDMLDDTEIYEQLYIWEPEVGGSIDRFSTLVGESFKGFKLRDDIEASELSKDMITDANNMSHDLDFRQYFETYSEIILMTGNLLLEWRPDYTLTIIPNKTATILDRLDRINNLTTSETDVMTEENFLVINEGLDAQRILRKGQFIHVKYKSTPVYYTDAKGRRTYNIYAASPLHRVIIAVWWKRISMIIDILWRYKNVPREHHQISGELFSLEKYAGDTNTRRTAAKRDLDAFIDEYISAMNSQVPDQGYVTSDGVTISMVENKNMSYVRTNELIAQINEQIWGVMHMPRSMISGESHSSYASELVVSNYVENKVIQVASRVKNVILQNMRERLRAINPSYPTDKLDIIIDLELAASRLEATREFAIMVDSGLFTKDELRAIREFPPLRPDQVPYIKPKAGPMDSSIPGATPQIYPDTPESNMAHPTDTGKAITNQAER